MKDRLTAGNLLTGFCILVGTVFPLFMTHYYFNIQKSKSLFFIFLTLAASVALILLLMLRRELFELHVRLTRPQALFFGAFLVFTLLSAIVSPYRPTSFTGSGSRYIGFWFLGAGILCSLILLLVPVRVKLLTLPLMGTALIVAALGIFNLLGMNLFGLVSAVPEALRGQYLSTLGYSSFFSGYLCLMASFGTAAYIRTEERALLPILFIVETAMIASNNDSGIIGFFAAILLLPFLFRNVEGYGEKLSLALVPVPFAILAARLLYLFGGLPLQPEGFTAFLFRPALCPVLLGVLIIAYALCRIFSAAVEKETFRLDPLRLRKIIALVFAVLFAVFVLLAILSAAGILPDSPFISGELAKSRGYIWNRSLQLFADAPFLRKLVGTGPDTLKLFYRDTLGSEMTTVTGQVFDSAHNIFLQYLLSVGLFGLISFLGVLASVLIPVIRKCRRRFLPLVAALIAYLVQAFFVPEQPMVTPFIFLLLGLVGREALTASAPAKNEKG